MAVWDMVRYITILNKS